MRAKKIKFNNSHTSKFFNIKNFNFFVKIRVISASRPEQGGGIIAYVSFRNTIRVSTGVDPDQDRHSVGPDRDPNFCKGYQQTTKVAPSKERVNESSASNISWKTYQTLHL